MPEGGAAGRRTSTCKGPEEAVLGDVKAHRGWSRGSRGWCYREQGGSRAHVVSVPTRSLALTKTGSIGGFQAKKPRNCCPVRRLTLPLLRLDLIQSAQLPCAHSAGGQVRAGCSRALACPSCLLSSRSQSRTGLRGSTCWQREGTAGLNATCSEGEMSLSSTPSNGRGGAGHTHVHRRENTAHHALCGHQRPL